MTRPIPRLLLAVALVTAACSSSSPSLAQVRRSTDAKGPANAAWARTVEGFAKALAKGDLNAADGLVAPRATVRRFDGQGNDEVWTVFERTMNAKLVGGHGYVHPPHGMAGDLAVDFKKATGIPDAAKARFLMEDESDLRRANATAVQWLEVQLDAKSGMLVGAIVMWTSANEPVFVLVRGEESGGAVRIRSILYGTPGEVKP
jgi:hypothetical protein